MYCSVGNHNGVQWKQGENWERDCDRYRYVQYIEENVLVVSGDGVCIRCDADVSAAVMIRSRGVVVGLVH